MTTTKETCPLRYYVQVISHDTGDLIKELGPYKSERLAEKAMDGVDRNLNHELYFTGVADDNTR